MTEEQWIQLREILTIEGFEGKELETILADFRRKPEMALETLNNWKLVTDTKH